MYLGIKVEFPEPHNHLDPVRVCARARARVCVCVCVCVNDIHAHTIYIICCSKCGEKEGERWREGWGLGGENSHRVSSNDAEQSCSVDYSSVHFTTVVSILLQQVDYSSVHFTTVVSILLQ